MQDIPHILEVAFESTALVFGYAYLVLWGNGGKPTNRQALSLFAIGFALMLSLNLLSSTPTWWLLLLVIASWSVKPLKKLLTKPASQNKMIPVRKPSALPERSDLSD